MDNTPISGNNVASRYLQQTQDLRAELGAQQQRLLRDARDRMQARGLAEGCKSSCEFVAAGAKFSVLQAFGEKVDAEGCHERATQ